MKVSEVANLVADVCSRMNSCERDYFSRILASTDSGAEVREKIERAVIRMVGREQAAAIRPVPKMDIPDFMREVFGFR